MFCLVQAKHEQRIIDNDGWDKTESEGGPIVTGSKQHRQRGANKNEEEAAEALGPASPGFQLQFGQSVATVLHRLLDFPAGCSGDIFGPRGQDREASVGCQLTDRRVLSVILSDALAADQP